MRRYIANLPLRQKITSLNVLTSTLILSIVILVGIQLVINAFNQTVYRSTAASLAGSAAYIENSLDNIVILSNILMADDTIQENLAVAESSDNAMDIDVATQRLYYVLAKQFAQFERYHLDYIILKNNQMTTETDRLKSEKLNEYVEQTIDKRALDANGAAVWTTEPFGEHKLYLSRTIREISRLRLRNIGTLTIAVDPIALLETATQYNRSYETIQYALMTDDGQEVYISDALKNGKNLLMDYNNQDAYRIMDIDDHKYFAVKGQLHAYGWTYYFLVPYDDIHRSIQTSYITFTLAVVLVIAISLMLSNILTGNLTKHFESLVQKMENFNGHIDSTGNHDYDYSNREDEIGLLHREFDNMTKQIHALIHDNYTKELVLKDTQLKALESQLNPHFLYNTLESVNWRAKSVGAETISLMVESLGRLLRATLSKDEGLIPLRDELAFLQDYINIQQLRYEEMLAFTADIPKTYYELAIPRLLLQPLVENAIRYGLEENPDGCHIRISAELTDSETLLKVTNSGSSIDTHMIEKLENNEATPHGTGIGLLNIHQRLKMTYGDDCGLSLESDDNSTTIIVHLPQIKTEA